MPSFENQTAVITGASSGIGRAIALDLAAHGASLCIVGRNRSALEAVVKDAGKGTSILIYTADLSSDDSVRELVARLTQDCPSFDILVHSAGAFSRGTVEVAPVEDFDRQYRVNVRAPYLLTQLLLSRIRASRGQIVFINSSAGLAAHAEVSQYAATKYALKAVADSLRAEVNPAGIRVLSIYPGRTATPMQATVHRMEGREYHPEKFMQPEDVAAVVTNALLLPGTAEVTDIQLRPMAK